MTAPWQGDGSPEARPRRSRSSRIWRGLGKFLLYGLAFVGFATVAGFVIGLIILLQIGGTPDLPDDPFILSVDLDSGVVERSTPALGPFGSGESGLAVRPLIDALERAASDPNVLAVTVNAGNAGLDLATAEDVRGALQTVTAAGKPVYAFAPSFGVMRPGTVDYFVVSAADELWIAPSGDVNLIGFSLESPFIGGALDLVDVVAQFGQREEYKSAIEIFTRSGLSEPARESQQRVVDVALATVADAISADRGLPRATVDRLIDGPPTGSEAARDAGLVDRIGYRDEFVAGLENQYPDAAIVDISLYGAAIDQPEDPVATIAYIQALGPVIDLAGDESDTTVIAPDNVGAALADALDDPTVDAVILRIDSPGGSYTGSDAIWRQVVRLREAGKPVVASMGSVAASGGYFIAMAADRIVAQPNTLTGSIGVFAGKFVVDAATRQIGITWDGVVAGENAAMYSMSQTYSPDQWQAMNATLDRIYEDFVHKAAAGRQMPFADLEVLAGGRVWTGADALDRGLIDALGGPSQALGEVRALLDLPADAALDVRVLPRPRSPLDELMRLLEEPEAAVSIEISLPPTLAPWPEILEFMNQPGAIMRLPPMRIAG